MVLCLLFDVRRDNHFIIKPFFLLQKNPDQAQAMASLAEVTLSYEFYRHVSAGPEPECFCTLVEQHIHAVHG